MRFLSRTTLTIIAALTLAATALASLSGVFLYADTWDAEVDSPAYTTAKEDPGELIMRINSANDTVECKYTGWIWAEGPQAEGHCLMGWEAQIIVRVNGQPYVSQTYPLVPSKPIMPNAIFMCEIPAAAFNTGDNIVQYYISMPNDDNPSYDGWYFEMKVTK